MRSCAPIPPPRARPPVASAAAADRSPRRTRPRSAWRWIPISNPSWSPDPLARMTMKLFKLAAALLVGSCAIALAQSAAPSRPGAAGAQSGDLPANANVVGSGPIVMPPPAPRPGGNAPSRPRGDFTIHSRHLLYVTLPGSLERPMFPNGNGIVVLDADNNYAFVKRIHLWDYSGSMAPEDISGVAASPATNMLYLTARGR